MKYLEKRYLLLWFLLIALLGACATAGLGGNEASSSSDGSDGSSSSDGNDGSSSSQGNDGLFEAGPIDIPINIAKLDSPNPEKINITLGSAQNLTVPNSKGVLKNASLVEASFTCQDGAIPNPSSTPFLYVLDVTLGTEQFVPADANGKCEDFVSNCPTLLASAVSESATAQMSAPIFIQCDPAKEEYNWVMTNTSSLFEGALTMFDNTMTAALDNNATSANLSPPSTLKQAETPSYSLYTLGVGGQTAKIGEINFVPDQLLSFYDLLVIRSGDKFYNWSGEKESFELVYDINDEDQDGTPDAKTEIFEQVLLNELDGGLHRSDEEKSAYVKPYANELYVQTNKSLTMVNLRSASDDLGDSVEPGDFTKLVELKSCESVRFAEWNVGWGGSALWVHLHSTCSDTPATTVYEVISIGDTANGWELAWNNKEVLSYYDFLYYDFLYHGFDDESANPSRAISLKLYSLAEGSVMPRSPFNADDYPEITFEAYDASDPDVESVTDPVTLHSIYRVDRFIPEPVFSRFLGSQGDDGEFGARLTGRYTEADSNASTTAKLTKIEHATVYKADVAGDVSFIAYCAPINDSEARIHIYFVPSGDIIVLDEQFCTPSNNWQLDRITGNLVVAREETVEGSSVKNYNIQFLDPDCDVRFVPDLPDLIASGNVDCEASEVTAE